MKVHSAIEFHVHTCTHICECYDKKIIASWRSILEHRRGSRSADYSFAYVEVQRQVTYMCCLCRPGYRRRRCCHGDTRATRPWQRRARALCSCAAPSTTASARPETAMLAKHVLACMGTS